MPRAAGGVLDGVTRDAVHHDVVGVAVAAVPVVADDRVGVLLVEDGGHRVTDGGGVRHEQGVRGGVGLPAGHARVGEAQPDEPVNARGSGGRLRLGPPVLGEETSAWNPSGRLPWSPPVA